MPPSSPRPGYWLDKHQSMQRSGVAVAGTWGRGTGRVDAIALATPDGAGAFIDPTTLTPDDDRALGDWLASDQHPKALHDAKGPMHALAAHGYVLNDLTSDTALAAYLALPGQRTFDLAGSSSPATSARSCATAPRCGDVQLTLDAVGGELRWR